MIRLRLDGPPSIAAEPTPSPAPERALARAATTGYPTDDRLVREARAPGAGWAERLARSTVESRPLPRVDDRREAVERETGFGPLGLFMGPLLGTRLGGASPLSPSRIRVPPFGPE